MGLRPAFFNILEKVMIIKAKRILNIEKYLSGIEDKSELQLSVPFEELTPAQITKIGFSKDFRDGDTVLPTEVGRVSEFNSSGRWHKLKNKPKENRFMFSRIWRWKEFSGRDNFVEREEERDVYRDCYQRKFEAPPSEELTIIKGAVVSRKFEVKSDNYESIKHAINLFLELFGVCHIISDGFKFSGVTRKVNWVILPPGDNPWKSLELSILKRIHSKSLDTQRLILDRQKTINSYKPIERAVGVGGFEDYIAYIFDSIEIVALESVKKGNAIYVFSKNWESFSKLSKAQILNENLHLARIVHSKGWKTRLKEFMHKRQQELKDAK